MCLQRQSTLTLPGELLRQLLAHLPPESIVSLALTCRALHAQLLPGPPPAALSQPARATLVTWLEKDNPLLYWLCHDDCHDHGPQLHTRSNGFASFLPFTLCPVKYGDGYPELVGERTYGDTRAPGWLEKFGGGLCEVPEFLGAEARGGQVLGWAMEEKEREVERREWERDLEEDRERRELERRQGLGIEALRIVVGGLGELGLFEGLQMRPGVLMLLSRVHSGAARARRGRGFESRAYL